MEPNTEGASTPYVPTKEDLEEWLAYWRGVYPERGAGGKKGGGERAVLGEGEGEGGVVEAGKRGESDIPGTFRSEHESHVNARVRGEWDSHSEGLKAMEEGRVKGVLRK